MKEKRPATIADYIRSAPKAGQPHLQQYKTTQNFLQIPYSDPLPIGLIRKIAEHRLRVVSEREDDGFW